MRPCPALLATLLLAPPLQAEEGWFTGVQLHLALPQGTLREDLRGHPGSGVGASGGYAFTDRQALRANLDFLGTRSSAWPGGDQGKDLNDIWRTLRLGAEHVVRLDSDRGPYAFYGGGVQNAWVNRTEGSLGEITLFAFLFALGGTTNSAHYGLHGTELDNWSGFATAGLGLQSDRHSAVEVRWIGAPYLRYRTQGLRTVGPAPTERVLGHQAVLSFRLTWY